MPATTQSRKWEDSASSVIGHYFYRQRQQDLWKNLIAPALGAVICAYLWLSLTNTAKLTGAAWMLVGVAYLAVLTRGFKIAPKEMTI